MDATGQDAEAVVRQVAVQLAKAGVPSPEVDARLLVEHATEVGEPLEPLVARRVSREPLQYILGRTWFRTLTLAVAPGVVLSADPAVDYWLTIVLYVGAAYFLLSALLGSCIIYRVLDVDSHVHGGTYHSGEDPFDGGEFVEGVAGLKIALARLRKLFPDFTDWRHVVTMDQGGKMLKESKDRDGHEDRKDPFACSVLSFSPHDASRRAWQTMSFERHGFAYGKPIAELLIGADEVDVFITRRQAGEAGGYARRHLCCSCLMNCRRSASWRRSRRDSATWRATMCSFGRSSRTLGN